MGWVERIFGLPASAPAAVSSRGPVHAFDLNGATSEELLDFLRGGAVSGVNARTVLRNPAVARSVFVLSNSVAMLPFPLMRKGADGQRSKASDHATHKVLNVKPNTWQTPFTFRRLMQHRALVKGNAYALPIRSLGDVKELIPLDPDRVTPKQRDDWSVFYEYRRPDGGIRTIERRDMVHIMGPSDDGLQGLSLVEYAGEALDLALKAQRAAAKLFSKGMMAGGMLSTDSKLTEQALAHLKDSLAAYEGADNAGRWIVGEQGLKATPFGSAKDSQNVETRRLQVEEVARIFGVPRPFLMMDDTSWGSGIEQLAIFFVQYGLAPWFKAWEDEIDLILLTDRERGPFYSKFNEHALLRGSIKDQAEFFAKALGSGGGRAWMAQDEVREVSDLAPKRGEAAELSMGMTAAGPPVSESE